MKRSGLTERQLDSLANDGRLSAIAMWLAIQSGEDWPSLSGDERDKWHEYAIAKLRSGEVAP